MGFENFLIKIREHWLAVLLLTLLLGVGLLLVGLLISAGGYMSGGMRGESLAPSYDIAQKSYNSYPGLPSDDGFAPNEEDRKIERSASLVTEVGRGEFETAQTRLASIVSNHRGIILNQNVNKYGQAETMTGHYAVKVPVGAYNETVAQLKEIGELDTFQESATDVTGQYTNAQIELANEKARLERYQALYQSYGTLSDKLQLEDRVFDQQRRLEYLQSSLANTDERVEYATLSVTLREEEPVWAQVGFVKFRDLVRTFVASVKALLYTIAAILPWAILGLLIWLGVRFARKH